MKKLILLLSSISLLATLATNQLLADSVSTKDGSKIQGRITSIEGGVITIDTTYAGALKINQSEVTSIATDSPVYLRFKGGNTIQGSVTTAAGEVRVASGSSSGTASVANVEGAWLKPEDSPEAKAAAAAARAWAYEASLDAVSKDGNTKKFTGALSFSATLKGQEDKLVFYTAIARAKDTGVTTTNQAKGGIDYTNNFKPTYSWYVRSEIGTDKIKDLNLYNNTAFGLGMDLIRTKPQVLTFRTGLAYRFESYEFSPDVSSPALEIAFIHDYNADTWRIGNKISWLPTFEDFGDYLFAHDSFFETPLAASAWKIRLGISNDFNSQPSPGKKSLDTTYYTKFVLNWK